MAALAPDFGEIGLPVTYVPVRVNLRFLDVVLPEDLQVVQDTLRLMIAAARSRRPLTADDPPSVREEASTEAVRWTIEAHVDERPMPYYDLYTVYPYNWEPLYKNLARIVADRPEALDIDKFSLAMEPKLNRMRMMVRVLARGYRLTRECTVVYYEHQSRLWIPPLTLPPEGRGVKRSALDPTSPKRARATGAAPVAVATAAVPQGEPGNVRA